MEQTAARAANPPLVGALTLPASAAAPPRPAAGRPAAADSRLAELLLAVATAANAAVLLLSRHLPYQDAPNHLARYVLMDRFWSGRAPANIDVHFAPGPYLGIDLIGVGLVRLVGAAAAGKVIALAALTLLPLGMYLLLRRVAFAQRGWALAGVLLGYSWFMLAGMLNFAIGVGLSLVWLAAWWPRRERAGWGGRLALAAGAAALFPVHMAAALTVLVVVWTDVAVTTLRALLGAPRRWRSALPQATTALLATVAVGGLWALASAAGAGEADAELIFRGLKSKLAAFGAPFYSLSLTQAGIMAAGYVATLAAFLRTNRRQIRLLDTFVVTTAAFLVLFLIFPKDVGGAGATDVRWLMPMYLLPFCAAAASTARPSRAALGVAFAACLVNAASVWAATRDFDRRLDDFDAALRRVPPTARVLPLISDQRSYPRVGPYQQYALWHTIRGGGYVPGLWALGGTREGEHPIPHLRHFVVRRFTYHPSVRWGTTDRSPLDWPRIAAEYDYIVQTSDDDAVRAYVAAHARETARVGAVRVFQVVRPGGLGGAALGAARQ